MTFELSQIKTAQDLINFHLKICELKPSQELFIFIQNQLKSPKTGSRMDFIKCIIKIIDSILSSLHAPYDDFYSFLKSTLSLAAETNDFLILNCAAKSLSIYSQNIDPRSILSTHSTVSNCAINHLSISLEANKKSVIAKFYLSHLNNLVKLQYNYNPQLYTLVFANVIDLVKLPGNEFNQLRIAVISSLALTQRKCPENRLSNDFISCVMKCDKKLGILACMVQGIDVLPLVILDALIKAVDGDLFWYDFSLVSISSCLSFEPEFLLVVFLNLVNEKLDPRFCLDLLDALVRNNAQVLQNVKSIIKDISLNTMNIEVISRLKNLVLTLNLVDFKIDSSFKPLDHQLLVYSIYKQFNPDSRLDIMLDLCLENLKAMLISNETLHNYIQLYPIIVNGVNLSIKEMNNLVQVAVRVISHCVCMEEFQCVLAIFEVLAGVLKENRNVVESRKILQGNRDRVVETMKRRYENFNF